MGPARSQVDVAVSRLLDRIASREFADAALPREGDLAEQTQVGRTTLREAVKVLQTHGVLRVEQGRGTYVNPVETWRSVEAVAGVRRRGDAAGRREMSLQLLEIRRMIELGAIELFVPECGAEHLHALEGALGAMERAESAEDVAAFVAADLAFHDVILNHCGNVFVPLVFRPIAEQLWAGRRETSGHAQVRRNTLAEHRAVLEAIRTGDPPASVAALDAHFAQTRRDLVDHVLYPASPGPGAADASGP